MHSVLGPVGSRRRPTASTALLNASAFGLRGYVDTLSCLVAMHLLDRSCVIVGIFLNYYVPQQSTLLVTHKHQSIVPVQRLNTRDELGFERRWLC